jgi:hypothetical protein
MTNRNALLASVSLTATVLVCIAMWLLAFSDESTSGLVVFGAALSVLAIAGLLIRGEAEVPIPRMSGRAIVGGLVLVIVGVVVLAAVVDRVDESSLGRSNTGTANRSDSVSGPAGDPEANDAERRRELQTISDALIEYHSTHGSYPSTSNNVQTACNYPIDQLCAFEPALGKDAFLDPRGSPDKFGYWYKSDGSSFILFASLESEVGADESCPSERHLRDERVQNVFCFRSP